MSSKGTRAVEELRSARIHFTLHEYDDEAAAPKSGRERAQRPAWGLEAALALGVDPRRIFKTLIANVDGRLVVAVIPVADELDLKRLAAAATGRRAELADPAEAERATGYVVGGISPVGQRRRLPTFIDASASDWPTILVSGGRRGLQVEIVPGDLLAVCGGTLHAIGRATTRDAVVPVPGPG